VEKSHSEGGFGDGHVVEADAFTDGGEVRGGVEPDFGGAEGVGRGEAVLVEDGGGEGGG